MSQDFKQSSDTAHNSSAPLLAPEGTPDTSSQDAAKKRKRRRIELAVGAVALAGVLYLPFSPIFVGGASFFGGYCCADDRFGDFYFCSGVEFFDPGPEDSASVRDRAGCEHYFC